jgi:hypothetical protein
MKSHIFGILSKTIDIEKLLVSNPKLFNFSKLEPFEKIELLRYNAKLFADKIDISEISAKDRALLIIQSDKKVAHLEIEFTDDELRNLPGEYYVQLVKINFTKYIRKDIYDKLCQRYKRIIFSYNPKWVMTNSDKIPKMTSAILTELAYNDPKFVGEFIKDFSDISVGTEFWRIMISHDEAYKEIFIKNTNSCVTKTDVRSIIYLYPELIKKLDTDILANSKLTCKEWLLLADLIITRNDDLFENWKFSDDMVETFRLDLMAEMLNGKSKLSTRFQNAMSNVFDSKDTENENASIL